MPRIVILIFPRLNLLVRCFFYNNIHSPSPPFPIAAHIMVLCPLNLVAIFSIFLAHLPANLAYGKHDFIDEELDQFQKYLKEEWKNFEMMKNNKEYGWEGIEPQEKLAQCLFQFDIGTQFGHISDLIGDYIEKLTEQKFHRETDELAELEAIKWEVEKFRLERDLLGWLKAKTAGFPMEISEQGVIAGSSGRGGGSSSRRASPVRHYGGHVVEVETDMGRRQMLQRLHGLRQKVNEKVQWLNMVIWFKKPKKILKEFTFELTQKLEEDKHHILVFMDNFVSNKAGELKIYPKIEKLVEAKRKKLVEKFGKIKKRWDKKVPAAGQAIWPTYREYLATIQVVLGHPRMTPVDLKSLGDVQPGGDRKERKAVEELKKFVGEQLNAAVKEIDEGVEQQISSRIREGYDGIRQFAILDHASAAILKNLLTIFGGEKTDQRGEGGGGEARELATLWFLVEEYVHVAFAMLSKNEYLIETLKRKFKWPFDNLEPLQLIEARETREKLWTDGEMDKSGDVQIRIAFSALKVLALYEELNKLHKIGKRISVVMARDSTENGAYRRWRDALAYSIETQLPFKKVADKFWLNYVEMDVKRRSEAVEEEGGSGSRIRSPPRS